MRLPVLRVGIVNVVGRNQRDTRVLRELYELLIDRLLDTESVILKLQEKVIRPEDIAVAERCFLGVLVAVHREVSRHLAG